MDPYQSGMFSVNPYYQKSPIFGRLVVVLQGRLQNRSLQLITPISRAVRKYDIHELIVTDETSAAPGQVVNNISYLGFMEVTQGGVMVTGDEVWCDDRLLGVVAGFDETHMPNHLNIVLKHTEMASGAELAIKIDGNIAIHRKGGATHG